MALCTIKEMSIQYGFWGGVTLTQVFQGENKITNIALSGFQKEIIPDFVKLFSKTKDIYKTYIAQLISQLALLDEKSFTNLLKNRLTSFLKSPKKTLDELKSILVFIQTSFSYDNQGNDQEIFDEGFQVIHSAGSQNPSKNSSSFSLLKIEDATVQCTQYCGNGQSTSASNTDGSTFYFDPIDDGKKD